MKIGDTQISYDYYRYLFLNFKYSMDNGDPSYWTKNPEKEPELREKVLSALKETAVIYKMADDYSLSLENAKSDAKDIYTYILNQEYIGDVAAMEEDLKKNYITPPLLEFLNIYRSVEPYLFDHIIDEANGIINAGDEIVINDVKDNFYHASHILIAKENHTSDDECLQIANEALAKAKSGVDFDSLITDYCEDEVMLADRESYYFTKGEFAIPEFENSVKMLKVGEISEIVISEYGYHIIKRLPIEEGYIDENLEKLRTTYKTRVYYEMKEAYLPSLEITYFDLYDKITLDIAMDE